jgi:hypothetical protein
MRKGIELLSLAVLVGMAGCAGEETRESAEARAPARDLTLQTPVPATLAIASPVELERPVKERPRASEKTPHRPRAAKAVRKPVPPVKAAPVVEPITQPAPAEVIQPAPAPVAEAAPAGAGRELAPGETITVIPASAGPSSSDGDELDLPVERARAGGIFIGRGGGTCRPKGGVRGFRITLR